MTRLSRRKLLRGAGGVAISLPFLDAMMPRRATAAPSPKRFVFFFFSNGVNVATWAPPATATPPALTLTPALTDLAPLKSKLVMLTGVNMNTARANSGNGHNVGMTNLLVARKFILESKTQFGDTGWGAGISLDQELANRIGGTTKFPSLQFGVQTFKSYKANAYSFISYSGPQKPVPSEDDPQKMFTRIFTDVGANASDQQARVDKRKSVLDFVSEDFKQISARLGAADRNKMDSHLATVRDIESRLSVKGEAGIGCSRPTQTYPKDFNANSAVPQVGKLQMDLLAMAFACDLTRVATLQWSSGQSGVVHSWPEVGTADYHHGVSHKTDPESVGTLFKIQKWYMSQLAYLGSGLDRVRDANGGTILDNTALLSGSEVGVGQSHTFVGMPFLLLGGCGGSIKTDRWLRYNGANHNDLYVSILNAMGVTTNTFGDPMYSTGPLPGLVG